MSNSEKPNNTKDDCISRQAAIDAIQNVGMSIHIASRHNLANMKEEIQAIIYGMTKAQTDALMKLQPQECAINRNKIKSVVDKMVGNHQEFYMRGFHDGVEALKAHLELCKEEAEDDI